MRRLYGYTDKARVYDPATTITARGTIGVVFRRNIPYFPIVRLISVIGKKDIVNPDFLYYCLRNTYIDGEGSVQAQLTVPMVPMISNYLIIVPSLSTQRRIASILSSLDDKIAVNRRICENLEAQAQALFKHWFIDFAPFKDGKFVESELGMIPEGWRVYSFPEIITPSSTKVGEEGIPEFSVTNTGIHPRDSKFNKQLSKSSSKNKLLCKNDLVFGMSREILNWGIMEEEKGGVSPAYYIYKVDQSKVSSLFLKEFISHKISYFKDLIKASTREGQSLDKGALFSKYVYMPSDEIYNGFLGLWTPIKSAIDIANQESSRLATLRDTLLPKLMSGQIKV